MNSINIPQWSRFWSQGFITTFGAAKPNNYDGVVRTFWREKFVDLPEGARILDIAAGNGAIATLAAEVNKDYNKHFFITATDLAEINDVVVGDADAADLRRAIVCHSNIPCERQPFDDDSFDIACSQFGFEYSDIASALAEIRRVLAEGGRFVAISHHTASALIEAARVELDIYRYALHELDLFGRLGELFDALGDPGHTTEQFRAALRKTAPIAETVNEGMNDFRHRFPDHECSRDIAAAIDELARGAKAASRDHRLAAVSAAAEDLGFAETRLKDMVNAALNREQVDALRLTAAELGFNSAHCLDLYGDDGMLAGWQIHLR